MSVLEISVWEYEKPHRHSQRSERPYYIGPANEEHQNPTTLAEALIIWSMLFHKYKGIKGVEIELRGLDGYIMVARHGVGKVLRVDEVYNDDGHRIYRGGSHEG